MEDDRLNSPDTCVVNLEVLGHRLQISQDPNSKHLGTTVWDASLVFIKYLILTLSRGIWNLLSFLHEFKRTEKERNSRKGRFCASKLKGKRAIELGAGCGLAGLGMALLGCDVVSTDQVAVLPLLMRNVERNTSWIMQANPDSATFGSINVAELDWGNEDHIKAVEPPFDYIIGTDVVYSEHLLEPLLQTILALSGPRTKVLLGYEIRSTTVHERMLNMWKSNFEVKTVPQAKMDCTYRHPSIQLFIMEPKAESRCEGSVSMDLMVPESSNEGSNGTENNEEEEKEEKSVAGEVAVEESSKADDWETRRYGAMAARLLRDVQIL